jgi:Ca2+-binding EF-hand superfamily protein
LTAEELEHLGRRFDQIAASKTDDGVVDKEEFLTLLGLGQSPCLLTDRIYTLFDADGDGCMTKTEFLGAMEVLHPKGLVQDKIKLAFRFWDVDQDGYISEAELCEVMTVLNQKYSCSLSLSSEQCQKLVSNTFKLADTDESGHISLKEFERLAMKFPGLLANMTMDLQRLLEPTPTPRN